MAKPCIVYEAVLIMNRQGTRAEVTRLPIVHETRTSFFTGKKIKNQRTFSKRGALKRIKKVTIRESRYTGYVFDEADVPELIELLKTCALSDLKDMAVEIRDTLRQLGRWNWDQNVTEIIE